MKYFSLILFVAFTACGGGGNSAERPPLQDPVIATLSISQSFPIMYEKIEITFACTNMSQLGHFVGFSKNFVSGEGITNDVLNGQSYNHGGGAASGSLWMGFITNGVNDHFYGQIQPNLIMPSYGNVYFYTSEFALGEYSGAGKCQNYNSGFEDDMDLTFTVLSGNFDLEIFDNAEFQ